MTNTTLPTGYSLSENSELIMLIRPRGLRAFFYSRPPGYGDRERERLGNVARADELYRRIKRYHARSEEA